MSAFCLLKKLLVFEYGQFKHAQREITPKLVRLRVLMLGVTTWLGLESPLLARG